MSISYEEALMTLQSMFGEPWTRETLDAVLRHQQGHMENTVDLILRHGDRSPQSLVDQLKSGVDLQAQAMDADEQLARQLAQEGKKSTTSTSAAAKKPGRGKPTVLPADFLRIPSSTPSSTPADQLQSDEALARMLQDELFTQELRQNPDFAHLARGRPRTVGGRPTNAGRGAAGRGAAGRGNAGVPEIDIMKSLGDLGNNARRRLQMLAAQFNAKKNQSMNGSAATGGAGGSSGAVAERRGLLDGNDDEDPALEFAARKDL